MKIVYNKFLSVLLAGVMVFSSGCEDVLDIDPQESIDASKALNTSANVESAIIGLYSNLGGPSLYGTNLNVVAELLGSEENARWQGTFQGYRELDRKTMTADNSEASRTWINAYQAINLANIILENLSVVDEDIKDRVKGEALLIRGILHFELVRLYAKAWNDGNPAQNLGIPIKLKATTTETAAGEVVKRSTVAQVYNQVVLDLTDAKNLLPEFNENRATTYTASAFLARVYLQQGDYVNARDEADRVIESSIYRLNPSVIAAFRNDNTAEVIFEIQQNDQNNAGNTNNGLSTFYASLPGIGRGDLEVVSHFDSETNPNRYTTYDLYEAEDARLNELFYIGTGRRAGNIRSGKWISPGQNIPIIRLAEMYLIRAEANERLGTEVGATPLADVNIIRERAGLEPLVDVTLDDILLERRLELAYEGQRIHDLKRTQTNLQRRDASDGSITSTIPWNANELVLPIPKREIDATNEQIQQNPGY